MTTLVDPFLGDPSLILNMSERPAPRLRELPADLETPISVYLKLAGSGPSFLLESVTGGEQVARYSFIGVHPRRAFVFRNGEYLLHDFQAGNHPPARHALPAGCDPLDVLRAALDAPVAQTPGLPRFAGGLVGYLSYEMVRYFEPSVPLAAHPDLPEAIFLQADILVAFDHAFGRLLLIENGDPAHSRLDEIERRLSQPLPARAANPAQPAAADRRSNQTRAAFTAAVRQAKEHIAAGDIFQVVLSQRFSRQTGAHPFDIYRALRRLNPSPYMFYFDFDHLAAGEEGPLYLIGASPEIHTRLEGRQALVRPIAGTRRRGASPAEDAALAEALLADPKERAEHVMLLDLGRNDLGRICEYGSVHAPEQMVVERYSHVMHIVSQVEGRLRPEFDAFDLLRATFPAGTVSGAPKIRAMQIIDALEPDGRGPYAGVVGYFSYDGSMDTCIAIRTMVMQGQRVQIQSGAGIVADSDPDSEYQETLNKAQALEAAVELAEGSSRPAAPSADTLSSAAAFAAQPASVAAGQGRHPSTAPGAKNAPGSAQDAC